MIGLMPLQPFDQQWKNEKQTPKEQRHIELFTSFLILLVLLSQEAQSCSIWYLSLEGSNNTVYTVSQTDLTF